MSAYTVDDSLNVLGRWQRQQLDAHSAAQVRVPLEKRQLITLSLMALFASFAAQSKLVAPSRSLIAVDRKDRRMQKARLHHVDRRRPRVA